MELVGRQNQAFPQQNIPLLENCNKKKNYRIILGPPKVNMIELNQDTKEELH